MIAIVAMIVPPGLPLLARRASAPQIRRTLCESCGRRPASCRLSMTRVAFENCLCGVRHHRHQGVQRMPDGAHNSEHLTRTGGFLIKVWRRDEATWSWRMRIEVVETGEWEIFDSMQEALWYMRQHMTADVDDDADADLPP